MATGTKTGTYAPSTSTVATQGTSSSANAALANCTYLWEAE